VQPADRAGENAEPAELVPVEAAIANGSQE
jgi:hypothetical protein